MDVYVHTAAYVRAYACANVFLLVSRLFFVRSISPLLPTCLPACLPSRLSGRLFWHTILVWCDFTSAAGAAVGVGTDGCCLLALWGYLPPAVVVG